MDDFEIGEMEEDGALDERDEAIATLRARINQILSTEHFSSIEVAGVRANVAIISTIIRKHGGRHLLDLPEIHGRRARVDEVFTDAALWGFTPWPDEIKIEWRRGCDLTFRKLIDVISDQS